MPEKDDQEQLPIAHLIRLRSTNHGTEGLLVYRQFSCYTMELPWRQNQRNISCIPSGLYLLQLRISPHFGRVYWITDVPSRSYILIHSGNWAGDIQRGLKTHTNGCVLLGKYHGWLQTQRAVLCSRPTVSRFRDLLAEKPLRLNVIDTIRGNV